jgi:hypothetical protein
MENAKICWKTMPRQHDFLYYFQTLDLLSTIQPLKPKHCFHPIGSLNIAVSLVFAL